MLENISYDCKDYGIKYYKEKASVFSCARPFKFVHEGIDSKIPCILGIHGFGGYSGELIRPAVDLYEKGYDFYAIRLPGHGTSAEDFTSTNSDMWLNTARTAYEDLKQKYDNVYIIGHSMGGLIATIIGVEYSIPKMALIAPALIIPMIHWWLKPLSWFVKKVPTKWEPDPGYKLNYENAPCDDIPMGKQYWSTLFTVEAWELEKLRRKGMKMIKSLNSEILVLSGENDLTVSPKVLELIKENNKGKTESVYIKNGTHLLQYDKDDDAREKTLKSIVKWFDCCKNS